MIRRPEGESELTYEDIGGRVMDLRHTAVPDARSSLAGSRIIPRSAIWWPGRPKAAKPPAA